jgi:hypothetical protein
MDKRFSLSLITSALVHGLLIYCISTIAVNLKMGDGDKEGGGGKGKYRGVNVEDVLEKEKPVEVTMIDVQEEPKIALPKKQKKKLKNADLECPGNWYGGIGIQSKSHPLGEEIEKVFSGYPADLAGLQVGDVITSVVGNEITGPPGTPVHMVIMRNGRFIKLTIIRGKVCYGG